MLSILLASPRFSFCFNNLLLLLFCIQLQLQHSASFIPNVDEPEIPWHSVSFDDSNRNKKLSCTCGDSTAQSNKEEPPPWQVLIYATKSTGSSDTIPDKICSGTIMNDRVILTAASCLMELPNMMENKTVDISWFFKNKFKYFYQNIVVALLPSKKTLMKDIGTEQILEVEQYDFNLFHALQKVAFGKIDLDIALLKLKNALNFNDPTTKILPICLPTQYLNTHLFGSEAHSSGWKAYVDVDDSTGVPPIKNVVFEYFSIHPQKIRPRLHCRASVSPVLVSETFMCSEGASLFEVYDAGNTVAPVMITSKSSPTQFVMIGIHSWSTHMVFENKPAASLETNVSGFLKVIESFSEKGNAQWCDNEPNDKYDEQSSETETQTNLIKPQELIAEYNKITSVLRQNFMLPESTCHCGILNSETKTRIQGGTDATPYDFGFQVMILRKKEKNTFLCGGTIINDKVVLTAAHCVRDPQEQKDKVVIGDLSPAKKMSVIIKRYAGVSYKDDLSEEFVVEYVVSHIFFKGALSTGAIYDVALLILKERLDFQKLRGWVSPICLPETGEDVGQPGREDAVTLGWGRTDVLVSSGSLAKVLQELQVKILSKSKCTENWDKGINAANIAFPDIRYSDSHLDLTNRICAGTENNVYNYQDALQGDSGGPLFLPFLNNTPNVKPGAATNPFIQVGIVSIVNTPLLKALYNISSPPAVVIYISVQDMLPFIDYYSLAVKARWCTRG